MLEHTPVWSHDDLQLRALTHYSRTVGRCIQRKARTAHMALKAATLPLSGVAASGQQATLQVSVVQAQEILTHPLPEGESPICWN